jgi:hypothetical protein
VCELLIWPDAGGAGVVEIIFEHTEGFEIARQAQYLHGQKGFVGSP